MRMEKKGSTDKVEGFSDLGYIYIAEHEGPPSQLLCGCKII